MDWSRWWIGVTERDELCRFCGSPIKSGQPIVIEEVTMEPECILCHWERVRALVRKAKPKPKPKGDRVMPWKSVDAPRNSGANGANTPISKWAAGTILEGELVQLREGKFGPIFEFKDDKLGTVVYPVRTRLGWGLEKCAVGDRLRIECLGKIPGPSGTQIWDFNVLRDE